VEQLGTDAYVTGNVGSGTPQEMMEWVEYMTSDAVSPMANLRRQNGREKPWRLPYFGIANEPWGCGGNMRAEYYADEYRKYDTFVKNYDRSKPVYRIAAGANSEDYRWTEVMMSVAGRRMDGLSLHYYTVPGNWRTKGSATQFGEDQWFATLQKTLRMDELIAKHSAAMEKVEAEWKAAPQRGPMGDKKVGLVVDEWGTWYDQEPGSIPGFLYQQNTLRDALVAALNFHIFHRHAGRVTMANIAQTVNVLQAMILTDKEKMLRTPTYWVFEMLKVHQGGTFLPVELRSPDYVFGQERIPMVSASATRAADGSAIHLSLANTSPAQATTLSVKLAGLTPKSVAGRVLTAAATNAHNTFEAPEAVRPAAFSGAAVKGDTLEVRLPAKSVVVLALK
jgi:alpha-N-arabinofuranosidase